MFLAQTVIEEPVQFCVLLVVFGTPIKCWHEHLQSQKQNFYRKSLIWYQLSLEEISRKYTWTLYSEGLSWSYGSLI